MPPTAPVVRSRPKKVQDVQGVARVATNPPRVQASHANNQPEPLNHESRAAESTPPIHDGSKSKPDYKIAHGSVRLEVEAGHCKIRASFNIDADTKVHFSGHFNPAVEEFQCTNARLQYFRIDQLTTSRGWNGKIGKDTISLNIDNGPAISGVLDQQVDPATRVSGGGTWFNSMTGEPRCVNDST